jgi:hypothetical protein
MRVQKNSKEDVLKSLKTFVKSIVTSVAATLSIGSAFAVETGLTCLESKDAWAPLSSTDHNVSTGTDEYGFPYDVRVDINRNFGGVGVGFWIKGVNVLESRAAAGAGWQTTSVVADPTLPTNRYILFNQGAGNTKVSQWGYYSNYSVLSALDYNPLWADDWHPFDKPTESHPMGPCPVANGYKFDHGKLQIAMAVAPTSGHGNAVLLTNQYTYQSQVIQDWPNWSAQQALYFDRTMAKYGALKIYLKGKSGWKEVIDPFDIHSSHSHSGSCLRDNSCADWLGADGLEYALFVWNIFGQEFGLAIVGPNQNDQGFRANINRQDGTFGDPRPGKECDPGRTIPRENDRCGVIEWHTYMKDSPNTHFGAGQITPLKTDYRVGTIRQLADWGYTK